jgi:Notch-like protein
MEYTGMYCDEDVEGYCSGIACEMGTCTDSVCVCDEGYEGASCDVNSDDCLGDPCGMYGNCTDGPSSFTCACESGYNGTLCNEDVDDCAAEPCGMYGSCTDAGANAFNCSCNMEYAGVTCTENADGYCGGIACGDMGTCSEENVCECMTGYTGASCDEDVDDCAADPCGMYGASCVDAGVNDFNCTCITGYQGELCDEDVDDCAADPCMYGTCSDDGSVVSQFNCTCDMEYAGDLCDENAAGYCAGSMCVEGTCTDDVCVCTSGWDGVNCDEDFDDCAANPCIEDLGFSDFLSSASTYEDIVLDDYFLCQDFGTNNYTCTLTVTVAANTMAPSIVSALLAAVVAFMAL